MREGLWLRRAVLAIGAITLVSGLVQMLLPHIILEPLSAETTPASLHLFAIVGMFMLLFGGLLVHAVARGGPDQHVALLWAALQKFGASGAVALGVAKAVFASIALVVAAFDLLSGFAILAFWRARRGP